MANTFEGAMADHKARRARLDAAEKSAQRDARGNILPGDDYWRMRAWVVFENTIPSLDVYPPGDLHALIRGEHRDFVAAWPSAPQWALEALAADPDSGTRGRVARNPAITPEMRARLAADPDPWVRVAVAETTTDRAVLAQLASDPDKYVSGAARRATARGLAGVLEVSRG